MENNKYEQALSLYNCELDDEAVARQVATLLNEHLEENNTKDVKKFLFKDYYHQLFYQVHMPLVISDCL